MYAFIAGLPTWVFLLAGIIAGWLIYRYWKHKKATAYQPHIVRLQNTDFTTLRDNPKMSK